MSDLAAQCRYTPSAVTRTADRLVALGFAERISCPSDRRVVYLAVTEAGADAVQASLPDQVDAIRTAVFSEFDADEIDVLDRLLHKVRDTVHPCATASTPLETVAV